MKFLILGKGGQLGYELCRQLQGLAPFQLTALDAQDLDLCDAAALQSGLERVRPDVILNAAAYTAVDQAEKEESLAMQVNAQAPERLAQWARIHDALLVHYSTDYVFDGRQTRPYVEDDAPHPLNAYGRSKLAGEQAIAASGAACLTFRTSWVYGLHGRNFLLTMQRLLTEREEIKVVDDQVGAPTWARHLAQATMQIVRQYQSAPDNVRAHAGLYHMTNGGQTSWYGFAAAIAQHLQQAGQRTARVTPIPTSEYPTPAQRPLYSLLNNDKLEQHFGIRLPDWDTALEEVFRESRRESM